MVILEWTLLAQVALLGLGVRVVVVFSVHEVCILVRVLVYALSVVEGHMLV